MIDHMILDAEKIMAETEAKRKAEKELASHGAIQAGHGRVGGANDTIDGGEGGEVEDVVAGNQTIKGKGDAGAGGNETTELEGAGTAGHGLKKTGEDVDSPAGNETVSSAEQGTLEGEGGGEGAGGGEGEGGGEAVGGKEGVGGGEGAVGGGKSGDSSSANGETFHLFHLTHSCISINFLNFCYMQ